MEKEVFHYEEHEDAGMHTEVTVPKILRPLPFLAVIGVFVCVGWGIVSGMEGPGLIAMIVSFPAAFIIFLLVFFISAKMSPDEVKNNTVTYHEKVTVFDTPTQHVEEVIDLSKKDEELSDDSESM